MSAKKHKRTFHPLRFALSLMLMGALFVAALILIYAPRTAPVSAEPAATPALTAAPTAAPIEVTPPASSEPTAAPTELPVYPEGDVTADSLVPVRSYVEGAQIELKYASSDNLTGERIYAFTEPYLRFGTAQKLAEAERRLNEHGLSLVIWDAYRPFLAQEALWTACPDSRYVADPSDGFSAHSRGNTVDIAITALDGTPVALPSGYDDFTALADRDYADVSAEARANAELLEGIMTDCGFKGYSKEWWHFTDVDSYPPRVSLEGDTEWRAECENYLSLRKSPDTEARVLARVPAGGAFDVILFAGDFAKVLYEGEIGWLLVEYLTRETPDYERDLSIVSATDKYTYEQVTDDLAALAKKYSSVTLSSIGESAEGRKIHVAIVGDAEAPRHVLIQAAMHAREHMTTLAVMSALEYMLEYRPDALDGVCFHIIPMLNPDGVSLAQAGEMTELLASVYASDKRLRYTSETRADYPSRWKANANGVDLNRNFPAGWEALESRAVPSCASYKGASPLDQPESLALAEYTRSREFVFTVSYHSSGSHMYTVYGDDAAVNARTASLGAAIEAVTGYPPIADVWDGEEASGGFKDWAMTELSIPSVTLEMGSVESPLPLSQFDTIYYRNRLVLPAIAAHARSAGR